jgi:hypothetical protein
MIDQVSREPQPYSKECFDELNPRLHSLLVRDAETLFNPALKHTFAGINLARHAICYAHWLREIDSTVKSQSAGTMYVAHAAVSMSEIRDNFPFTSVRYTRTFDASGEPLVLAVEWGFMWQPSGQELENFRPGYAERLRTGNALGLSEYDLNEYVFPNDYRTNSYMAIVLPGEVS